MPCIYKRNNKGEEHSSSCHNEYKEKNMKEKLKNDRRFGSGDRRSCTFYALIIPERRKEKRRKSKM